MDASEWKAELRLQSLGNAASERLLQAALLLVAQTAPGRRAFPSTVSDVQELVNTVPPDKWMVDVSVADEDPNMGGKSFHLWIKPNGDGSLRLELACREPDFEFDHVLSVWADGEVFGQKGEGTLR